MLFYNPLNLRLRFIALLACLLSLTLVSPSMADLLDDRDAVGPVMILPFQIHASGNQQHLSVEIPNLIAQRLGSRGIRVIPQEAVSKLLDKYKISNLDLATVRKLARELNAESALYGSYSQLGDSVSIDSRLVYTSASDGSKPIFAELSNDTNLLLIADDIATKVTNELHKFSTIAEVEVRGTKILDPDVVLLRIDTKRGDYIDPRKIDNEFKRIWDLGFFSDIVATIEQVDDGLLLVYTVSERPRISTITIEGNSEISQKELLAILTSRSGSILNDKVLAADLNKVHALYRQKGHYLAVVDYEIFDSSNAETAGVQINIIEGDRLYIQNIKFEGAENISHGDLRDELSLSEHGMFSWITSSGVLREELMEHDVSAITAYYLKEGYMDVVVGQPDILFGDDGITITHKIKEGPRYKTGIVRFSGELIDSDEELAKLIELDNQTGKYFSMNTMQDDTKILTSYYAEYGYAYANITPNPIASEEGLENTLDVVFSIQKKQKVYIRGIILEGNTRTRDNVILRDMQLVDGEVFDGKKLASSMRRINMNRYFDNAQSELVPTSNPSEVDLKIKVIEGNTGAIIGGVGYSTYSDFGVSGTIKEDNLWGMGYQVSFGTVFTGKRTAYDFNITDPRFNDTKLLLGLDIYNWKDDFIDYERRTTGGGVRWGYPLGEYSGVFGSYHLERYHMYDFDDDASPLITQYGGRRWASVVSLGFSRNTTDRLHATEGTIFKLTTEYGGGVISGDDDFIKVIADYHIFKSIAQGHTLHFGGRAAGLFKNNSDSVPVYQRFWMGGINSVRGYRSRDIVPRDINTGDRLGGTRMAYVNLEYIYSLDSELGISLVPFFDAGVNIDTDQVYNFSDQIKKSVGMELRWRSPLGDLRFAYGYPLDDDWKGDKASGRFEFSMGQSF